MNKRKEGFEEAIFRDEVHTLCEREDEIHTKKGHEMEERTSVLH